VVGAARDISKSAHFGFCNQERQKLLPGLKTRYAYLPNTVVSLYSTYTIIYSTRQEINNPCEGEYSIAFGFFAKIECQIDFDE